MITLYTLRNQFANPFICDVVVPEAYKGKHTLLHFLRPAIKTVRMYLYIPILASKPKALVINSNVTFFALTRVSCKCANREEAAPRRRPQQCCCLVEGPQDSLNVAAHRQGRCTPWGRCYRRSVSSGPPPTYSLHLWQFCSPAFHRCIW